MISPEGAIAQLAAIILSRKITAEDLEILQDPITAAILVEMEPNCRRLLLSPWSPGDFKRAANEYERLFEGTPIVDLEASSYLEENPASIASSMQSKIDRGHLLVPTDFHHLAPDHTALLLLAWSAYDEEEAKDFREANLDRWLPRFANDLMAETSHPLYQLVARLILIFTGHN